MSVQKEDNLHFVYLLFSYSKKNMIYLKYSIMKLFFSFSISIRRNQYFPLFIEEQDLRKMWTDDDVRQVVTKVHMAVLVRLFQFTHLISEKNEIFCVHGNFDNILYTFIILSVCGQLNMTYDLCHNNKTLYRPTIYYY